MKRARLRLRVKQTKPTVRTALSGHNMFRSVHNQPRRKYARSSGILTWGEGLALVGARDGELHHGEPPARRILVDGDDVAPGDQPLVEHLVPRVALARAVVVVPHVVLDARPLNLRVGVEV